VVLLGAALVGVALWRRLAHRLARSRSVFLEAEERMQRLASSDLLTGLANRAALHDAMAMSMARAVREGRSVAVLMIDLDRFKPVNDRHGHMVGDRVLREVAQRLRRTLRRNELQARYGGDEFVVLVEEEDDPSESRAVAERVVQVLSQPMRLGELVLNIGASVGIARFPADARQDDELLRRADSALYRAKSSGRGRVCFYDQTVDGLVAERAMLEQELREGIGAGQFVPFYQPIVGLADGEVRSVEMLCRWQHPRRGLLAPVHFIALAEDTELIDPLLLSILARACVDMRDWPAHWRLSINLSPQQMLDASSVPRLLAVLKAHGVAAQRLDVELTESALVTDTARAGSVMRAMKDSGMTVTLDDFGTGYSSLSYIHKLPVQTLKVDRSFVSVMHESEENRGIVRIIIDLARLFGFDVVAEGIETEADAHLLRALACDYGQGFLYARPMPAAEAARLLEDGPSWRHLIPAPPEWERGGP
jgi:diguanylate cyclase (GGDEF)-like protein